MYKFFCAIALLALLLPSCAHRQQKNALAINYFEQASLAVQDQNHKKALQLLNKSLTIQETPQALAFKATILYHLQDFTGSVALFEKIINQTKDIPPSLKADVKNNYACVLNYMGEKEKAAKIWKDLIKDPDYLTPEVAYFNIGLLALSQNDIDKALDKLHAATEAAPDYVDAYFYLGIIYMQQGSLTQAKSQFKSILSYAPEHKYAKEFLKKIDYQNSSSEQPAQEVDEEENSNSKIFSLL